MRSRTEQVTNTVDGSDYDDDTDFEDSEEDWRPEKGDSKAGLKRKSLDTKGGAGRRGSRNSGVAAKRGRKAASGPTRRRTGRPRRSAGGRTSVPSDEEEDDEQQEDSERNEEEHEDDDDDDGEEEEDSDDASELEDLPVSSRRGRKSLTATGKNRASAGSTRGNRQGSRSGTTSQPAAKPILRKVVNMTQSFPDKSGILKLYAFKDDLREGIRDNLKVCLWRRDGSSLLQKYFRDKTVDPSTPQFTSSMVYSCWEDKRAYEYMEVKVRCIEQSKQLRVQIVDVEAVERRAKEEYREYVTKYERLDGATASGNGSSPSKDGDAGADNEVDTAGSQGEDEDGADDNDENNIEMGEEEDASEEEEEDPPQEE
ncbi:hypothetical protein AND_002391 [Anopheles darlingi]|uniref:Uncharacterized protein n=1 Tax=Anopheles darlingi TaxID=43151 RepID=W5JSG1_ANODA|nr:uncharacterized protein LOC125959985 [Anopheles darlingi]ETN65850.1 hypothetical protein AND_002391 [Anopheles darlingi]